MASIGLQSLLRWFYEEACSSSFILIGVVSAGRPESDLGATWPVGAEICMRRVMN